MIDRWGARYLFLSMMAGKGVCGVAGNSSCVRIVINCFLSQNRGLRRCYIGAEHLIARLATLTLVINNFLLALFCSSSRQGIPQGLVSAVFKDCTQKYRVLKYRAPAQPSRILL
jgi:hypothetical protein